MIRVEEERDERAVENLTREAFWNLYTEGADEHFVLHNLRKSKDFIP
jgi:predicted N-acetyltransferase YhbS